MPSLWSDLRRRWLGAEGGAVDHLCPHLLRDIGLLNEGTGPEESSIRGRNFSGGASLMTLQASR